MTKKRRPHQEITKGDVIVRDENIFKRLGPGSSDVSSRATSIARLIDRLPPGHYIIEIEKPHVKQAAWDMCAWKREKVQKNRLTTDDHK